MKAKKPQAGAPALTPEERAAKGRMATSATVNAAAAMEFYQGNLTGPEVGFMDLYDSLTDRVEAVQGGDLSHVEAMLFSQATALQTLFASLARKAAVQDQLLQYQTHLGLALKAQAASRATLEALVELKRPRQSATFIHQANVASGHQQVNTTFGVAEKSPTAPNKLLEGLHGNNDLDTRAPRQAGGRDQGLEAVGKRHRTANT